MSAGLSEKHISADIGRKTPPGMMAAAWGQHMGPQWAAAPSSKSGMPSTAQHTPLLRIDDTVQEGRADGSGNCPALNMLLGRACGPPAATAVKLNRQQNRAAPTETAARTHYSKSLGLQEGVAMQNGVSQPPPETQAHLEAHPAQPNPLAL